MKKITLTIVLIAIFSQIWLSCQKDIADLTPPVNVENFQAISGEGQVELTWSKTNDADLKEFVITYSPKGMVVILDKDQTSYTASKLTGYTEYTFTLKSKDMAGNLSDGISKKAIPIPIDFDAPGEITNLLAKAGDKQVKLTWTNPKDPDFKETEIVYNPGGVKTIVPNTESSVTLTGLKNDIEHTFTLKTIDQKGNVSTGVSVKALPNAGDVTPPGEVINLTLLGDYAGSKVNFSWTNPIDADFKELVLTYGVNQIIIPKTQSSYSLPLPFDATKYTYTIKAKDETGNYSKGISVTALFGNFSLSNQDAINNIDPNLSMILGGKLTISGSDVTNLSPLKNLIHIGGKLGISGIPGITSLNGLDALEYVGGAITITNNPNLNFFCALKKLLLNGYSTTLTISGNLSNPTPDNIKKCN